MVATANRMDQIDGVAMIDLLEAKAAMDANVRPAIMVNLAGVTMSPDEERALHDVREGRARVVRVEAA